MEDKMVELARFSNPTEAGMLVSLLQSEGIDCYVRDAIMAAEFMGVNGSIGGAKVESLSKDFERARQIMRDSGYEVPEDEEETPETEDAGISDEVIEYERRKENLSRRMTFIIIALLIVLALIVFLNKFYKQEL